jgi:hypothetical protein
MRRSRLRCFSLVTSILLLAAISLPFVEVGDLLDDAWDDDGPRLSDSVDGIHLQRRTATAPPESPDGSSPPGVFAVALPAPVLEPSFDSATAVPPLPASRPARPSFFPRYLERGPPARG